MFLELSRKVAFISEIYRVHPRLNARLGGPFNLHIKFVFSYRGKLLIIEISSGGKKANSQNLVTKILKSLAYNYDVDRNVDGLVAIFAKAVTLHDWSVKAELDKIDADQGLSRSKSLPYTRNA